MPPRKTTRAPDCHPDRPYYAKRLCRSCYQAQWAASEQRRPLTRANVRSATQSYRAKLRLLCQVAGVNPRYTTLSTLLGHKEHLRRLHVAHKAGDEVMSQAWPLLSTPQKAAINYGKP